MRCEFIPKSSRMKNVKRKDYEKKVEENIRKCIIFDKLIISKKYEKKNCRQIDSWEEGKCD